MKASVFISYKRNVEPDQAIAARVFQALEQRGHSVFIDRTLVAGQEWAREIEKQIRHADFLIVFITAASSSSEMVKAEIEMGRGQAAHSGGSPAILPVRLAFAGPLPYPLNAWLDPIQYASWRGHADTERLIRELAAAVDGALRLSSSLPLNSPDAYIGPPSSSANLLPPGGGLDVDDPYYIHRESDASALRLIAQQGVTIVIKGSRQMGKTSLLVRTLQKAIDMGKRCALIDFQMLGQESLENRSTFFRRFASSMADSLDLHENFVAQSWDSTLTDSQNLTRYMEAQILKTSDAPIVLAIDEADILFQAEFIYDFFGMLRSWHNARANPLKHKQAWRRLDLVLVTSTEPYLFIDRDHESPFNVGEVLALSDLTHNQVCKLNELYECPLFPAEVDQLYELLHGQPYLTRRAFYLVRSGMAPGDLFARARDDRGPFGDHLRNYFLRLLSYPELASALKQVALGRGCADAKLAYRMESAGLVQWEAAKTVPRCRLYSDYFRERL